MRNYWKPLGGHYLRLAAFALLFFLIVNAHSQAETIYGQPDAPLVAEVLSTKIHTEDPEEMRYVILRNLTDRYAADQSIEVTQEEVDAYIEAMARMAENERQQHQTRINEIGRLLDSETLTAAEREALIAELDSLNQLLSDLGESANSDMESMEETQEAKQYVATAFIRQWKINRALYQEYGGRIIYQQGGPEPLDAYRMFLQHQEKQGTFTILKKEFEPKFWEYYVTDAKHSFYPAGSEEEAQAFKTPWWLAEEPEDKPQSEIR